MDTNETQRAQPPLNGADSQKQKPQSAARGFAKSIAFLGDKKRLTIGVSVLVIALVIGCVYALGYRNGNQERKRQSENSALARSKQGYGEAGTIQSVHENKVSVKSAKTGKITELVVDDKTIITLDSKEAKLEDVKRNLRVIAVGKKNDEGKVTATRLRLNK